MLLNATFAHINLIARDWQSLATFYESVFSCVRLQPERDLKGGWLDRGTGIPNAHIRGIHLRVPGSSVTLEILQYDRQLAPQPTAANRPGFGHIAFQVEHVAEAKAEVLRAGGKPVGESVTIEIPGAGKLTWVYVADPEDNIIELQKWH
ncbi:VOC family protein [candidate division KSB1 bacterium]|nr:VOC family protein [candidate division KSB1 bacterium]